MATPCSFDPSSHPRRRRARLAATGLLLTALVFGALSFYSQYPPCGGYPDWRSSPFVLPYPAGEAYPLHQANCTLGGHHAGFRYSYDFLMPIGALVTAARDGVVVEVLDGFEDGGATENWVKVLHADGTLAAYSHLHSLLVHIDEEVRAGQPIGLSGNTGRTGGVPHLHFHVSTCSEPVSCGTLAVTFSNTEPNPQGLRAGRTYVALPP